MFLLANLMREQPLPELYQIKDGVHVFGFLLHEVNVETLEMCQESQEIIALILYCFTVLNTQYHTYTKEVLHEYSLHQKLTQLIASSNALISHYAVTVIS